MTGLLPYPRNVLGIASAVLLALCCFTAVAHAAPPPLVPIQGYLTDEEGEPLNGTHTVRFRLYDVDTAGTALFDVALAVNVVEGFFTVYLGDTTPLDLALFRDNPEIYLGIAVSSDPEATPRLQIATTGFASLAAYCGDAETLGGTAPAAFQSRVVGTCPSGSFMQTVNANGTVTCDSADETDPTVGTLTSGRWCSSDGTTVTCTQNAPLTSESDPQVGALNNGSWCTSDGSVVSCTAAAPVEADPQVGALVASNWCTSNGTVVNCNTVAPVTVEADPQVGANTTSYVPRWSGTDLVSGRIYDNGALVGIGTAAPSEELEVVGDIEISSQYRFATPRTYYSVLGGAGFVPINPLEAADWRISSYNYAYMYDDAAAAGTGSLIASADLQLPEDATIVSVYCFYQDDSIMESIGYPPAAPTTEAYFRLYRRGLTTEMPEEVAYDTISTNAATMNTTPTSSGWNDTTMAPGTEVVDNGSYDYYLYLAWYVSNDWTTSLRFYGCRVGYQLSYLSSP